MGICAARCCDCHLEVLGYSGTCRHFSLHYLISTQYAQRRYERKLNLVGCRVPLLGELCLLYISLPVYDGGIILFVSQCYGSPLWCLWHQVTQVVGIHHSQGSCTQSYRTHHVNAIALYRFKWYGSTHQLCGGVAGIGSVVYVHAVACSVQTFKSASPMDSHILTCICCY